MTVLWVRWRYSPDVDWQKARIVDCDDEKIASVLERCAREFGAPVDQAERLRRDAAYQQIENARHKRASS